MAGKKRRTREELRSAALDAAYAIIASEGARGFNIRSVAAATGCSIGSIYNVFTDFDELEMRVVLRILNELGDGMFREPMPPGGLDRLRKLGERYLEFAFRKPFLWGMLNDSRMAGNPISPDWYRSAVNELLSRAEVLTAEAFVGSTIDVKTSMAVLWASVHGIAALGISGRLQTVSTSTAAALTELLLSTYVAGAKVGAPGRIAESE